MNQFDKHDKMLKGFFAGWVFLLGGLITFWGVIAFIVFHFIHKLW
jgi:hypothetical protein